MNTRRRLLLVLFIYFFAPRSVDRHAQFMVDARIRRVLVCQEEEIRHTRVNYIHETKNKILKKTVYTSLVVGLYECTRPITSTSYSRVRR